MANFFQGTPSSSRRRPIQPLPEMTDFSQPLNVPESVRRQWQPTAEQRAETARLDAQWNQMMQQGYQPPIFRPGQQLGLGGGYAQAAPLMPAMNRPAVPQIAMGPQDARFRRILAHAGAQGSAPSLQPGPAQPGGPEGPFPTLPGLPAQPPQMASVDNVPLAASGMRMLPVEPIRMASAMGNMGIPVTAAAGGQYIDPANVPRGFQFQMARHAPQSGVGYVGPATTADDPLTLESRGNGVVAVISPGRKVSDEDRKANIDRNRERREVTAMFRNVNRNRRASGQASVSRAEFEKLFPQFSKTELASTQGQKNRQQLLTSAALQNAAAGLKNGQVTTPADSQRFAATAASTMFRQFQNKDQTWEDALKAARQADKDQLKTGVLLNGVSIEEELKKLKEREDAIQTFENHYWQNTIPMM